MAKRNQKPEVRKAQREQAVRAAKDQKKATVKKPVVKVRSFNSFIFIEVNLPLDKLIFASPPPCIRKNVYTLFSRTRLRRRHRRQQRTPPRPAPAGLVARDKYFAFKFLWQFVDKYFAFKILWQFVQ